MSTYAKVIQPACAAVGLQALRADEIPHAGEIPEQVIKHLRDDDFVVADVTGGNSNVMYELGIRHTTGKCTVLIGEHGRLPFDISVIRAISFVRTPAGYIDARDKLRKALQAAISEGCDPTTASRLMNALLRPEAAETEPPGVTETRTPQRSVPDSEQPGFLEILAETELAFPKGLATLGELTVLMKEAADVSNRHVPLIQDADSHGSVAKLMAVRRFATEFTPIAERAETLAARYEVEAKTIYGGIGYLIDRLEGEPDLVPSAAGFARSVLRWSSITATTQQSMKSLIAMLESLGRADRQLRLVVGRYASALRSVMQNNQTIVDWGSRVRGILERAGWTVADIDSAGVVTQS